GWGDLLNLLIERDVFDEGFSECFYVAEVRCGVFFSCSFTMTLACRGSLCRTGTTAILALMDPQTLLATESCHMGSSQHQARRLPTVHIFPPAGSNYSCRSSDSSPLVTSI
ncbi:hypothetical protein B0H13DRAFT_1640692, partial [Mycena leptocephala]